MKQFLFRQKFRFDLGGGFLSMANVAMSAVTMATVLGWPGWLMAMIVPGPIVLVWAFGWILDRIGFMQGYNREANERNENWKQLFDRLDRLERNE